MFIHLHIKYNLKTKEDSIRKLMDGIKSLKNKTVIAVLIYIKESSINLIHNCYKSFQLSFDATLKLQITHTSHTIDTNCTV